MSNSPEPEPTTVEVHASIPMPTAPAPHSPEWERWRGGVDAQLETIPTAVANGLKALGQQMGQMESNLNGQFHEVRRRLGEVEHQTKTTNGRVNAHDLRFAEIDAEEETLKAAEARHEAEDAARLDKKRYTLKTLIGVSFGACTALGGIAAFLQVVGWLPH